MVRMGGIFYLKQKSTTKKEKYLKKKKAVRKIYSKLNNWFNKTVAMTT